MRKKTFSYIVSILITASLFLACKGDIGGKTVSPPTAGKVIDDYIAGAIVCADVNNNGLADDGIDNCVETDNQGGFRFSRRRTEPLVMTGGVDIGTGKEFKGTFVAPPESKVINPLTTLLVSVQKEGNMDATEAEKIVKNRLGLDNNIELSNFDPLAELQFGKDSKTKEIAKEVLAQQTNIQIILSVTTTTIVAASPDNVKETQVNLEAANQIAKLMLRPNNGATAPVSSINTKESIETVITEVAKNTFITPIGEDKEALDSVKAVSTVIAQQTQETTEQVVTNIQNVQLATQDNSLTAIKASNAGILLVTETQNSDSIKNIIKDSVTTGDTTVLEAINISTEIENSIDTLIERPIIKDRREDEIEIRPTGGEGGTV